MFSEATPELILQAYQEGIFPMAEKANSLYFNFYRPEKRGQLSITDLHIPKRLRKTVRQGPYTVTINQAFKDIVDGCALETKERDSTWINAAIRDVFIELHKMGFAHSVECWDEDQLAGGLYGIAIGRVFCGESMVSFSKDASKIALVHLCARLWKAKFSILDTQFTNTHLEQFGVYEMNQKKYEKLIEKEMTKKSDFLLNRFSNLKEADLVQEYMSFLIDNH